MLRLRVRYGVCRICPQPASCSFKWAGVPRCKKGGFQNIGESASCCTAVDGSSGSILYVVQVLMAIWRHSVCCIIPFFGHRDLRLRILYQAAWSYVSGFMAPRFHVAVAFCMPRRLYYSNRHSRLLELAAISIKNTCCHIGILPSTPV